MVNIRDFEDLNRSVLNKQNKDSVVEFALNMGKLLKNSQILLKNAAADLDSLKSEQLQNQCRLLKVEDELSAKKSVQLEAVKSTVDEKLSSWSSIVKKNTGKKVTQKEMKKAVKSAMNESDREYNVIMFNVEEQDDDNPSESYDADTAIDIMNSAGLSTFDGEFITERIGTLDKDRNRPLKVKFDFKSAAFDLLAKSKNLKDDEDFGSVFIVPDRSREERVEHRKLVEQLKLTRTQNPEKRCYIWNKKIYTDDS